MENNYEIEAEMIKNLEKKMEEMKELKELVKVFLENEEKVEMDDIRRNYMKESEIQEELKNVGIKNYLN